MQNLRIFPAIVLTALAVVTNTAAAQNTQNTQDDPKPVPSRVTAATVFLQGAELTQTASLVLVKGTNEISIEGLSPDADRGSLKVNIEGGVVISAHEFSIDYLSSSKAASPRLDMLRDSMKFYLAQTERTDVDIQINRDMQEYLKTGISKNVSGSEAGLGIDELRETMDYFKAKSEEVLGAARELQKRRDASQAAWQRVSRQYNEEQGESAGTSAGVLRLNLSAPSAGTFPATITYFTPSASWSPYYDINAASITGPIAIAARSHVRQTTGLDWKNVRLTLSSATPSSGRVAPLFSTWFLRQRASAPVQMRGMLSGAVRNTVSYPADITVRGVVTDAAGEPLIGATVISPAGAVVTNEAGAYIVGALSSGQLDFSFLGYESLSVPVNGRSTINVSLEEAQLNIDEVVVLGYGSQRGATAVAEEIAPAAPTPTIYDHVTTADNALTVTYNIDLPYDVPGNGKEQNIDLSVKEAAAEYKYYCAPKIDGATYLIAEIPDWEELGLLSAPANITYDGTYIGETHIDASATQEKLTLTLGTDKRVAVTRELAREFNAPRAIGGSTEQTFTYRITVRNSRTEPVALVLKDQYPTSTDKSVEVTFDSRATTPWSVNKTDTGVVTWEGSLTAGEVRTYTFSYTVRYPKGMSLNL